MYPFPGGGGGGGPGVGVKPSNRTKKHDLGVSEIRETLLGSLLSGNPTIWGSRLGSPKSRPD